MKMTPIASTRDTSQARTGPAWPEGVVEIGLLLPAKRAAALISLARERRLTVGEILRKLIDRELSEDDLDGPSFHP